MVRTRSPKADGTVCTLEDGPLIGLEAAGTFDDLAVDDRDDVSSEPVGSGRVRSTFGTNPVGWNRSFLCSEHLTSRRTPVVIASENIVVSYW